MSCNYLSHELAHNLHYDKFDFLLNVLQNFNFNAECLVKIENWLTPQLQ